MTERPALDTSGPDLHEVHLTVNGTVVDAVIESRVSLADFLRSSLRLTGTHLGCEQGACGACTVLVDGAPVRSCLLLAVQATGTTVATVESLASDGVYSALQAAFHEHHCLQCGFCTAGFLMTLTARLGDRPILDERDAREALGGNICRCTGYAGMVEALLELSSSRPRTDPG